ncbi:DUF952 domain-containing protein [Reichenbachiella agarivorans]|uniref:DUF952 domain-containing protein n=1 Tax=Reichenbachiella agarivorans TaxID=2979464 RepID=A0ABY6CUM1_9BACT|nr:DUF952 domain-containing protein [Reichenbachiella agarivorans]UXP31935.1 DUF952 domain-containing protein [Reichenbachiella agarivorans]
MSDQEEMTKQEAAVLQCYMNKEGDNSNKIILYSGMMQIVHKGKSTVIDFDKIKLIQVQTKKLIVALVGGGIGTSLSMMALPLGWYNYNLNLFSIFFFFGLMYWGFIGQKALVVEEKNHQHVFLLGQVNFVVSRLISHLYQRMNTQRSVLAQPIFHLTTAELWNSQLSEFNYTHSSLETEGFIHCSVMEELMISYQRYFDAGVDMVLLVIHPDRLDQRLEWEYVESRQARFPHVMGPINKSSIVSALLFHGEEKLQNLLS